MWRQNITVIATNKNCSISVYLCYNLYPLYFVYIIYFNKSTYLYRKGRKKIYKRRTKHNICPGHNNMCFVRLGVPQQAGCYILQLLYPRAAEWFFGSSSSSRVIRTTLMRIHIIMCIGAPSLNIPFEFRLLCNNNNNNTTKSHSSFIIILYTYIPTL